MTEALYTDTGFGTDVILIVFITTNIVNALFLLFKFHRRSRFSPTRPLNATLWLANVHLDRAKSKTEDGLKTFRRLRHPRIRKQLHPPVRTTFPHGITGFRATTPQLGVVHEPARRYRAFSLTRPNLTLSAWTVPLRPTSGLLASQSLPTSKHSVSVPPPRRSEVLPKY